MSTEGRGEKAGTQRLQEASVLLHALISRHTGGGGARVPWSMGQCFMHNIAASSLRGMIFDNLAVFFFCISTFSEENIHKGISEQVQLHLSAPERFSPTAWKIVWGYWCSKALSFSSRSSGVTWMMGQGDHWLT